MDKFTSMQVFCRVVELQHFAAAARELSLSTTMVSKHVSRLEKTLGVSLLNRTTRRLSLTDAGDTYYLQCKRLLSDLQELDASMSQIGNQPKGKLKVVAPADFGSAQMIPAIAAYQREFPNVAIELILKNRYVDLSEGVYDLALRVTDSIEPGLVARKLASTALCTFASPAYLERQGEPDVVDQLYEHQCLHFTDTPHGDYWVFRNNGDTYRIKPKWHFASNNGRTLCEAAIDGLGIIRVPSVTAAPYVRSKKLVEILSGYSLETISIYVIYLKRRFLPAKLSSFVRFLVDYFEQHKDW